VSYPYQEEIDLMEALPAANEKALQAVLGGETDAKVKRFSTADFIDPSFFREIEKSGTIDDSTANSTKRERVGSFAR
jgi:hypothetical protein